MRANCKLQLLRKYYANLITSTANCLKLPVAEGGKPAWKRIISKLGIVSEVSPQ